MLQVSPSFVAESPISNRLPEYLSQPVEQNVIFFLLLLLLTFILTIVCSINGLNATQGRGLLNGDILRVFR